MTEQIKDDYWEWWSYPFWEWYVRINLNTNHWLVVYCGKVIIIEIINE